MLIADDHPLVREGLAMALRHRMPSLSIENAGSVREAQALIAEGRRYTLVLLDLMLPDARGFSGLMALQHQAGATPIAIVSARREAVLIDAARALGAVGYIDKAKPLDVIADMVQAILAGERVFEAIAASPAAAAARARIADLSPAQYRVLLALADGRSNKQIAGDLDVSEATIKAHLTAIFRKLGVSNRAQALLAVQPLLGDTGEEPLP